MLTIGIIGTRGIPNNYGGFERFVELLVGENYWSKHNIFFKVYGEGADGTYNSWTALRSVGLSKSKHPFAYYIKSTFLATKECDIVFCCGVGLSFFAYWPIIFGKVLVINPDGCEWRRSKWSWIGRKLVRAMYIPALAAAQRIVIDAEALREDFGAALDNKAQYIGYQAPKPETYFLRSNTRSKFKIFGAFVLVIARLEPENNIQLIVRAFCRSKIAGVELIIVGSTHTKHYEHQIATMMVSQVRFIGPIYNQEVLNELRSSCAAYIHGHSVGGTNPSLLEALATVRGRIFCHDNKYNREVAAYEANYFSTEDQLVSQLKLLKINSADSTQSQRAPTRDDRFHPDYIALKYFKLFESIYAAD
jgi:glycosyltransferase involved in cell wall biosynthesis